MDPGQDRGLTHDRRRFNILGGASRPQDAFVGIFLHIPADSFRVRGAVL